MRAHLVLATLALALAAACGADPAPSITDPPDPGTGGAGGSAMVCDRDGDGYDGPHCDGPDCADAIAWIYPGAEEICANETDDDCDGAIDEGCDCVPGDLRGCYPGDPAQRDVGICAAGLQACGDDGLWGPCEGAVLPGTDADACDGIDQDCDGTADEYLRNACGLCGPPPREICGNGLDDDCDGAIDPPSLCRLSCEGIDATDPQPAFLACCAVDPATGARSDRPVRHSYECVAWEGLPGCISPERPCLSLDGRTTCVTACDEEGCVCGVEEEGRVVPSPACGFETPCAYLGCEGRTNQPCYTGPPQTAGVGVCRMGTTSCGADGGWGACEGEVLPGVEICGNGLDDDCDGAIDEEDGATGRRCHLCPEGGVELCGNGQDDDCDGAVDELCPALAEEQACYRGPPLTRGIGACADGVQKAVKGLWGPCTGDVLPSGEICGDGIDSDCNGFGGPGQQDDPACLEEVTPLCPGGAPPDACGGCGEAPCFTATFAEPGRCDVEGRTCNGVVGLDGDPTVLVPLRDKRDDRAAHDAFYVIGERGRYGMDPFSIRKFDRRTGALEWEVFPAEASASVLAIGRDGSVWAGTRATSIFVQPELDDQAVYHYDAAGNLRCRREMPGGGVAAIAVDGEGFAWVANGTIAADPGPGIEWRRHLFRLDPFRVEAQQPDGTPWPDGVPRCALVDLSPADPAEAGLVLGSGPVLQMWITADDVLWAIHSFRSPVLTRIDIDTGVMQQAVFEADAIGPDPAGAFWGWITGSGQRILVRIAAEGPYDDPAIYRTFEPTISGSTGFIVASDGSLWTWDVVQLHRLGPDRDSLGHLAHRSFTSTVGSLNGAILAEGADGEIWTLASACSGWGFARFDPGPRTWTAHCPEVPITSVLFQQGFAIWPRWRNALVAGRWTQLVDALHPGTRWISLDWEQVRPAGTSIDFHVAFADTPAGLEDAPLRCGPFHLPPVDLRACDADGMRHARVEIDLVAAPDGTLPWIANPTIGWTRP